MILYAKIKQLNLIEVFIKSAPSELNKRSFSISPAIKIIKLHREADCFSLTTETFDLTKSYVLKVKDIGEKLLQPVDVLDYFFSSKTLGHSMKGNIHEFRIFAPRAKWVKLIFFKTVGEHCDKQIAMSRDKDGIWETEIKNLGDFLYYGYCLDGPNDETELFDASEVLADPYSKAVLTLNHFLHPAKTLLFPPIEFNWEGDTWLGISKEDLIIYEMHIRDMTKHSSSGVPENLRGTYLGFISDKGEGGLKHLLSMGINCVELMPIQEFGNIEVDYRNEHLDVYNDWNVYERNHWGYMTSYFFAPESYYSTDATMDLHSHNGKDGRAITEFKTLVKTLHRHGIAVIMDVVYNHVSQYDLNPLKYIDKKYYFRLDDNQNFLSMSGCGNDFKTERPMARQLIIDSLLYWMTEFHVDGFRFDLAPMIDHNTLKMLTKALREINPHVILIAEPWGGGKYDLQAFSKLHWGVWNDLFRNGIKGQNPFDGLGLIFGHLWNGQTIEHIKNFISGSIQSGGGPLYNIGHAVNYLESHDDYSLGDFIRIGLREIDPGQPVKDRDMHAQLSTDQLKLHKLAALFLMTSQSTVMLHSGQEFGRSKVIAPTKLRDTFPGFIDHNSYNKDDETNWINYHHMRMNQNLVDYYSGLIALRKKYSVFRYIKKRKPIFLDTPSPFLLAYRLDDYTECHMLVLINCDRQNAYTMALPSGPWSILVDEHRASSEPKYQLRTDTVTLMPSTGLILFHGNKDH